MKIQTLKRNIKSFFMQRAASYATSRHLGATSGPIFQSLSILQCLSILSYFAQLIVFGIVINVWLVILSSLFRKLFRFLHQSLPRVLWYRRLHFDCIYLKAARSRVAQNNIKNSKGASRFSYMYTSAISRNILKTFILRSIRKLKKFSR